MNLPAQTIDLKVDGVKHTATYTDPIKVRGMEYILHEKNIKISIFKDKYGKYWAVQCI